MEQDPYAAESADSHIAENSGYAERSVANFVVDQAAQLDEVSIPPELTESEPHLDSSSEAIEQYACTSEAEEAREVSDQEEWVTSSKLASELGCGRKAVLRILKPFREEHVAWFENRRTPVANRLTEYLHPEAAETVRKIIEESRPPEGWVTNKSIANELGVSHAFTNKIAKQVQDLVSQVKL